AAACDDRGTTRAAASAQLRCSSRHTLHGPVERQRELDLPALAAASVKSQAPQEPAGRLVAPQRSRRQHGEAVLPRALDNPYAQGGADATTLKLVGDLHGQL